MLEDESWAGRLVAIAILAVPITLAALQTPDRFSASAVANKGLYNPNYSDTSRADQFSLNRPNVGTASKADTTAKSGTTSPTPSTAQSSTSTHPDQPPITDPAGDETIVTAGGSSKAGSDAPTGQSYGSFTLEDLEAQVPRNSEGSFVLDVPELYYTGGDIEVQTVLTGQPVETIAQVLPEKVNNDNGHRLRIFRMLVQCCAADARPYSIPIDFGETAPDLAEMSWIKVKGTMNYVKEDGQTVPILEVKSVEPTTEPDQSMIY